MSFSQLNANVAEGDVIIFTVMNNVNNISSGFYTMAAQYVGGVYQVYNSYRNSDASAVLNNLVGVYQSSMWIYGYIVGR